MHYKNSPVVEENLQQKIKDLEEKVAHLQQENLLFKKIIQSLSDLVLVYPFPNNGDNLQLKFINDAVKNKLKYSESELANISPTDLIKDDKKLALEKENQLLLKNGKTVIENRLVDKNGNEFPVQLLVELIECNNEKFVVTVGKDLSQLEKTKETLDKTEKSFQAIVNATQDIIMLIDLDTQILDANDRLIKILNTRKIDILGRKVESVFNISYVEKLNRSINDLLTSKASIRYTDLIFNKKWGIILYPVYQNDEIVSIAIYHKDLTAEEKAKQLLEENERRLRLIFKAANIGWWDYDYNENTTKRSDYWFEMLGYKKNLKTITPQFIQSIIHPDDTELFRNSYKLENKKNAIPYQFRLLHSDGNYRWIQSLGEIVEINKDGTPKRSVGVHMDITEKKEIEQKEQILLDSYSNILNNARDAIYLLDREGKFVDVNNAALNMYGYDKEFFIGKTPEVLSAPGRNDLLKVKEYLDRAYNGESIEFDFWGLRKNGEIFPKIVRVSGVNYLGAKAVVAFGLDITERYQAQEKLRISETKFKAIFNSIPMSVIHVDKNGIITEVNNYHFDVITKGKKSAKDFVGSNILERETLKKAGLIDHYKKLLEGTPFILNEVYIPQTSINKSHYFNIYGVPLFSDDKQIGAIITTQLVTERVLANKHLYEARNKLKLALDSAEAGIWDWKVNEEEVYVEGKWGNLKGLNENQKISMSVKQFFDSVHPEDTFRIKKLILNRLRTRSENYSFEFRIKDKSDKWIWIFIKGKVIEWNNNLPKRLTGTFHDISIRKKNELELHKTKDQLELAIQGSGIGIYSWEFKTDIISLDKNIIKSLGYTKHEVPQITSASFKRFIHRDDLIKVTEIIRTKFTKNTPVQETELRMRTPKKWHWFWVRGKVLKWDKDGTPASLYGTYLDITDQKIAGFALEKIERNYRTIYENAPIALFRLSKDNKILQCNRVAAELFGFKKTENFITAVNSGKFSISGISYKEITSKMNEQNFLEGYLIKTFDKKNKSLWLESSFISDYNNKYIDCFSINSTKRVSIEKENRNTNLKLKNLYRYMNNVREEERKNIARLVHDDLGQKLTALNLDVALLRNNFKHENEIISSQFDDMLNLINDSIQTVQRISTELRPGILDDLGLANAIQWQSNEYNRRTNLQFNLNLSEKEVDLPEEIKTQVFRVFQEALTNIIRHAKASKVDVKLKYKNNSLIFEVSDNGIGVTKEKLNDSTSYGIISMKERIETINGTISINNKLRGGTKIKISVPIREEV